VGERAEGVTMLTSELDWRELAYRGQPVEAIKAYRLVAGVTLAEAKEAVERWQAINLPPSPSYQQCQRIGHGGEVQPGFSCKVADLFG
jgi:hypothetical protein